MDRHVTVFSKPGCQQCVATAKTLDRLDYPFTKTDVTQDADAMDQAMAHGFTSLPIVQVVEDGEVKAAWSGYRDSHLRRLADGVDLASLDMRATPASQDPGQDNGPTPGGSVTGV